MLAQQSTTAEVGSAFSYYRRYNSFPLLLKLVQLSTIAGMFQLKNFQTFMQLVFSTTATAFMHIFQKWLQLSTVAKVFNYGRGQCNFPFLQKTGSLTIDLKEYAAVHCHKRLCSTLNICRLCYSFQLLQNVMQLPSTTVSVTAIYWDFTSLFYKLFTSLHSFRLMQKTMQTMKTA